MTTKRQDLATIEAQLEAEAANVSKFVSQPSTKKISLDRDGNFVAPGGLVLGTEIRICVIDFCTAHDFYTASYDPANPAPPVCFARGREIADLYPEESAPEPQSETCATCPQNEWGSGGGNRKACKNTRNLGVVLADDLDLESDEDPDLYLLSVPPSAIKSFDAAVIQCARMFNSGPIKAILTVKATVVNNQYTTLQFMMPEANPDYVRLFELREAVEPIIENLPNMANYKPTPKRPAPRAPAR